MLRLHHARGWKTGSSPADSSRGPARVAVASRPDAVVEVNHAVAEAALVEELELQADMVGEGLFAASHHDGREEQVALVDQPGLDRLGGEVGTAHGDVTSRCRFQLANRFRIEASLDPR